MLNISLLYGGVFVSTAGQKQFWPQHFKDDTQSQKERYSSFQIACRSGADRVTFEGKTDQQIKSQYNDLLKRKRENNADEGPSASGSSPPVIEQEYQQLVSFVQKFRCDRVSLPACLTPCRV